MKKIINVRVLSNEEIANGIFKMKILSPEAALSALPGQFAGIYPKSAATILPRPISICDSDELSGIITFVYRVAGQGTLEFSKYKEGEEIRMSLPLGNGFDLENIGRSALLIGGGIGVPPMLLLAKALLRRGVSAICVLGFSEEPFLVEDFKAAGANVFTSVQKESGKTVLDIIENGSLIADSCFSCGPRAMMFALTDYFEKKDRKIQISMEERMGCGYGACVGCVCDTVDIRSGEIVKKKVCKDGPVFWGNEVLR